MYNFLRRHTADIPSDLEILPDGPVGILMEGPEDILKTIKGAISKFVRVGKKQKEVLLMFVNIVLFLMYLMEYSLF